MVDNDDPFGIRNSDDDGRTVVRPTPGGVSGPFQRPLSETPAPHYERGSEQSKNVAWPMLTSGGLNPIERAAAPLIALQSKLASSMEHPDPEALRQRTVEEIGAFENNARMAGVTPEDLFVARYVLCTAIDEAVLNTPWGAQSNWDRQSLLVIFHKEARGGVRFFELLERMSQDPRGNLDLLELMYVILALGFKGQYRHGEDGGRKLEDIREGLFRDIRQQRGDYERALSPNWEGAGEAHRALTRFIPWWVIGAALATLLMAIFAGLSFKLSHHSAPASAALASIEVQKIPKRREGSQQPKPLPMVAAPATEKRLADWLEEDLLSERITLEEGPLRSKIVVSGVDLFSSGGTQIQENFEPALRRITHALSEFPGKVVVTGHTDNDPIASLRFPTNWHLSVARAKSVMRMLIAQGGRAERFEAEGRGDKQPLVPNTSASNRAKNRRVDITLFKHAGGTEPIP